MVVKGEATAEEAVAMTDVADMSENMTVASEEGKIAGDATYYPGYYPYYSNQCQHCQFGCHACNDYQTCTECMEPFRKVVSRKTGVSNDEF